MSPPVTGYLTSRQDGGRQHRWRFPRSDRLGTAYAADCDDLIRRAVYYLHRTLKGTKPADLPVEQPTKFQLVINLMTAKALGPHDSTISPAPDRSRDRAVKGGGLVVRAGT